MEQIYTPQEVLKIYEDVVAFSLEFYDKFLDSTKDKHFESYTRLMKIKDDYSFLDINEMGISFETLLDRLIDHKKRFNYEKGKVCDHFIEQGKIAEKIFVNYSPKYEYDKANYLFDFVTYFISLNKDYDLFCNHSLLYNVFNFAFDNGIPIGNDPLYSLGATSGTNDSIPEIVRYLGEKINLRVDIVPTIKNGEFHPLNLIRFSNGTSSIIDTTSVIKGNKTKDESFLISHASLQDSNVLSNQYDISLTKSIPLCARDSQNTINAVGKIFYLRKNVQKNNT